MNVRHLEVLIAAQLFLNWFDRLFVFLFRGMHLQSIQSLKNVLNNMSIKHF